jgi:hypothetical protein
MTERQEQFNKILLFTIQHMQVKLPSRGVPGPLFLWRSVPHVLVGFLISVVVLFLVPGGYLFPTSWAYSLFSLPNWFEILVYCLLTVIMVYSFSYSVGVLCISIVRRGCRYWLGKRIARQSASSLTSR